MKIAEAKKLGYDGLRLINVFDPVADRDGLIETTQWVSFEPTQIKSALGNVGAFNPKNASILYSKAPVIIGDSGRYTEAQRAAINRTGGSVTKLTIKETVQAIWKDAGKKAAQGLADQFRPIRDISSHAYTLTRLSKGATGAFEAFMHYGKLSLEDGA